MVASSISVLGVDFGGLAGADGLPLGISRATLREECDNLADFLPTGIFGLSAAAVAAACFANSSSSAAFSSYQVPVCVSAERAWPVEGLSNVIPSP